MKNIKSPIITEAQKSQIISESYKTGCVISHLAKSYGISVKTLYSWRSRQKSDKIKKEVYNNSNNQFVELSVHHNEHIILNKAELVIKYAELNLPIPEASLRGIDGKFSFGPSCFNANNRGKPRGIYPKEI